MAFKKHIAIITYGAIGNGFFLQGVPIIDLFIRELAKKNKVIVFSLHTVNKEYIPKGFELIAPHENQSSIKNLIWLIFKLKKVRTKNKIDIIHALWGFPAGVMSSILKLLFNIPNIIHLQGGDSTYIPEINYGLFNSLLKKTLLKWAYQRASELVVLTHFQHKELKKQLPRHTSKVIPFGVNKTVFYQRKHRPLNKVFQLIHIANLNKVKSQKTLLEAYKEICKKLSAHLTIIGMDTLDGSIQNFAEELGLSNKVTFISQIPNRDMAKYLHRSDILLHSSLYEAQAVAVAEALACGVPVCGTNVGLLADLSGECTLTSPIKDSHALAQNVLKLLHDKDLYQKLVSNGQKWSVTHDINWTLGKFDIIYNHLMRKF